MPVSHRIFRSPSSTNMARQASGMRPSSSGSIQRCHSARGTFPNIEPPSSRCELPSIGTIFVVFVIQSKLKTFAPLMPIDESRKFIPCRIAVMTVSDTRTEEDDTSGRTLVERAEGDGHEVVHKRIVADERAQIEAQLRAWIADDGVDVVIATGGTGVTGRDVTPEAFAAVYDKEIVGFGELFRWQSYDKIGTSTIQSRATGGVAGGTYLFAVPGSTSACRDAWDGILRSQLDARHRPCKPRRAAAQVEGKLMKIRVAVTQTRNVYDRMPQKMEGPPLPRA